MKINFSLKKDNRRHNYCVNCHSEDIKRIKEKGKTFYFCKKCGARSSRWIAIDPRVKWWVDKNKELWHESVGVFVFNVEGKILFFERTIYPFAYSIPAGHLEIGESPECSASRELKEESGLIIKRLQLFSQENIASDKCCQGADYHKWHVFIAKLKNNLGIKISNEGFDPCWLTPNEALKKNIVYPVKYLLRKYKQEFNNYYNKGGAHS